MLKLTWKINALLNNRRLLVRFLHQNEVRVRFAPSPTGNMHLGGLRTALYNFLFAKSHNGKFLLRIEDTDQTRIVEGAREQLQRDLNWAGIYIDEGPGVGGLCGPYIQSQRREIYKHYVSILLENGSAYRCFCSPKRLNALLVEAARSGQIPKYDNRCRHLSKDEIDIKLNQKKPYCVRFKLDSGAMTFDDIIGGLITLNLELNEGDPVVFKSDDFPTYHFANVVDDHLMGITHVLRGIEWQISTPKHLMLYQAFKWDPPKFGHLPLLLNSDGTKLSKRNKDIEILNYQKKGILPLALVNYILQSGGGFEKDKNRGLKPKCYTLNQLAEQFDIINLRSNSGKLMPERLYEFNRLELQRQLNSESDLRSLVFKIQKMAKEKFSDRTQEHFLNLKEDYIKSVLKWSINRIYTLEDLFSKQLSFLWVIPQSGKSNNISYLSLISNLKKELFHLEDFNGNSIRTLLKDISKNNDIKSQDLMQFLRSILSGLKEGPSVAEMIEILGKDNTLSRLDNYMKQNNLK